jgi:hypothetical protein
MVEKNVFFPTKRSEKQTTQTTKMSLYSIRMKNFSSCKFKRKLDYKRKEERLAAKYISIKEV